MVAALIKDLGFESRVPNAEPRRRVYVVAMAVTFVVTALFGVALLSQYPKLSPIDEMQHLDSTIAAANGQWYLAPGTRVSQETMQYFACAGYDGTYDQRKQPPPCDSATFNPQDFPQRGINTAAGRVSLFYPVTGYAAKAIDAVTGVGMLTAARTVSVLVWALGAAVLAGLSVRLSRSGMIGAGAGVSAGLLGSGLWIAVNVNPDSWSLLVGSLAVAVTLWMRRLTPWTAFAGVLVVLLVATLAKANFFALAALPFCFALPWLFDQERRRIAFGAIGACVLGGVAFLYFSWPKAAVDPADVAPMSNDLKISTKNPWDWSESLGGIISAILPDRIVNVSVFNNQVLAATATLTLAVMLAGVVVGLFQARVATRQFRWSAVTLVGLLSAPILAYVGMVAMGVYFRYPERYSLVFVPALAVAWVLLRPRRPAMYGLVALVAVAAAAWTFLQALV